MLCKTWFPGFYDIFKIRFCLFFNIVYNTPCTTSALRNIRSHTQELFFGSFSNPLAKFLTRIPQMNAIIKAAFLALLWYLLFLTTKSQSMIATTQFSYQDDGHFFIRIKQLSFSINFISHHAGVTSLYRSLIFGNRLSCYIQYQFLVPYRQRICSEMPWVCKYICCFNI